MGCLSVGANPTPAKSRILTEERVSSALGKSDRLSMKDAQERCVEGGGRAD